MNFGEPFLKWKTVTALRERDLSNSEIKCSLAGWVPDGKSIIMELVSISRSYPKRQKDVVMKSRSRSPINVDTKNSKLKNATKKINLSNMKEESDSNYYKSSKNEGDWDCSKLNILWISNKKAQKISKFMKSIF